ncbi:zinc metalloprotease, putative [Ixodes scapularis]|uniref:Zinc metalloprotease, putative n=1 Tax=Ixodes scapularis TaxID=6945 RepID=B7PPJ3_IXOSC|nr:zinc metalloprotease, putative [Ixodes scapularis]|eukprot:XP_002435685.1 zinc metalloprotease, putative [Ixodes scapularis]
MTSSFDDDIVYRFERDVLRLLESPLPPSARDTDVLLPLKHVVSTCVSSVNNSDVYAVLDLLSEVDLEGFPFTPPVRSSISAWKTAARVFSYTGASALLSLGVAVHPFKSNRDVTTVDIPQPLLINKEKTTAAYTRLVKASMKVLGKRFVPSAYTAEVVAFAEQLDKAAESGEFLHSDERLHRVSKLQDLPELKTVYIPTLLSSYAMPRVDDYGTVQLSLMGHRVTRCLLRMLIEGVSSSFNREILTRSFWSSYAKTSLHQAQVCLQEQLDVPASMSLSLLEDHTALKIVEGLYESIRVRRAAARDIRLPGAEDFSAVHLFFVYYGLGFCVKNLQEDEAEMQARRVNVPLRGSSAFQRLFNCRPTSPMGPLRKCADWMSPSKQETPSRSQRKPDPEEPSNTIEQ